MAEMDEARCKRKGEKRMLSVMCYATEGENLKLFEKKRMEKRNLDNEPSWNIDLI